MTISAAPSPTPRWPLQRPVLVVPVCSDGSPRFEARAIGMALECSAEHITLEFGSRPHSQGDDLLLGIDAADHTISYAGAEPLSMDDTSSDRIRMHCRFGGRGHDLLQPTSLMARFDPVSRRFVLAFPTEVLDVWCCWQILRYQPQGTVPVCPTCGSLPTFRPACPGCSAALLRTTWVLRHAHCGYLGFVEDWRGKRFLDCPGCGRHASVIGSEFLCLQGYQCLVCAWVGSELELFGDCCRCGGSFPEDRAVKREVPRYTVERFEPRHYATEAPAIQPTIRS